MKQILPKLEAIIFNQYENDYQIDYQEVLKNIDELPSDAKIIAKTYKKKGNNPFEALEEAKAYLSVQKFSMLFKERIKRYPENEGFQEIKKLPKDAFQWFKKSFNKGNTQTYALNEAILFLEIKKICNTPELKIEANKYLKHGSAAFTMERIENFLLQKSFSQQQDKKNVLEFSQKFNSEKLDPDQLSNSPKPLGNFFVILKKLFQHFLPE